MRGENDELTSSKVYKKKDVKEFIRLLKEESRKIKMRNVGFREAYYFGDKIREMIDKLAGEKLK